MDLFIDGGHELGECVLWCERTGRLLWTDIPASTLWAHSPSTGKTTSWPMPERLCSFALTGSDDRLLLGLASGLAFFTFSTGAIKRIVDVEADIPSTRLNDGRCDRQGRFVFGMFNQDENPKSAVGSFYRLNLDLTLERLPLGNVAIANSICFSPDGRRMYFADSMTKEIRVCDYNPCSGEIGASRVFIAADAAPGEPDGSCIDAEGYLWSTRWGAGQVMCFAPDGRLDRVLEVDAPQPSCPAFGGPDMSTLYVTSAHLGMTANDRAAAPLSGALFSQALDVRGLPESRFLHS
ncbi:SMP-30/gluconolactonase/LRE family protein [Telluria aromaticivorans]|uniref:SMP-30/gluconolactonase/LRE family protein n=1 Tax=Telluria aromaticivorans TaxID=2725995 RepID=A0A7Y2K2U1_9BURK|nr:SMP-30/gluconolactonase/LRE family protein [Telluria aromaticivorans]NNG24379.1 SMP-30/gluconolactonase/LRE family protein [Telluria aromaticivorans]